MEQAGGLIAPDDLRRSIDHWLTDGVITPEQAAVMREDVMQEDVMQEDVTATADQMTESVTPATEPEPELAAPELAAPAHPEHRTSLLIEALGYLGGVIILTAFILVLSQFWEEFTAPIRLATIGAAFVLLLAAGFVVPQSLGGPGTRLRSVLWFGATIAWAGVVGFAGNEYLDLVDEQLVLLTAGVAIPVAAVLWLLHRQPLQHLAFFASIVAVAGSGAAMLPEPSAIIAPDAKIGAMVWGVSVAWFLLAWGGIVKPRGLGFALGSIVAVFAAMTTMGGELESQSRPGAVLLLITLAALVIAAVLFRDFMLLVIAAVGSLQGMPIVMSVFFPGVLWAAFALLVIGAALIAAAIVIARSRRRERAVSHRNWSVGSQPAAITSAGLVLVGTAAAVVTTSLIA